MLCYSTYVISKCLKNNFQLMMISRAISVSTFQRITKNINLCEHKCFRDHCSSYLESGKLKWIKTYFFYLDYIEYILENFSSSYDMKYNQLYQEITFHKNALQKYSETCFPQVNRSLTLIKWIEMIIVIR